jgi:Domain of unknown function (DUF5916)
MILLALGLALAAGHADSLHAPLDARPVVHATRADSAVRIDGILDDPVWRRATPVTGFVQSEPHEGEAATEATQVWVAFDAHTLYVAAYLHDREPGQLVVNDIKKDFDEREQDAFMVLFDTFGDRRNGYVFITNPEGARADWQVANEGREVNISWDAMWTVKTRIVPDGWTAELAIPLRSLRFDPTKGHRWGVNFSRRIRRKNEVDFWSPVPRSYNLSRVSLAGDLVGLDLGSGARNLRVKPYGLARTVRETGGAGFDQAMDAGVDLKAGIGSGLTLDATINPDFAQVEADEQQVNLSQFSQFFPEKREFFLENSGIFYVGDAARSNQASTAPTPDEDLLLFFSRRVGLDTSGRAVSIPVGLRLTGSAGGFTLGGLSMLTRSSASAPASNYSVLRVRRNVGVGSDLGVLAMNRQSTDSSGDYNRVFGADANIRFFRRLDWNSYLVGTATPGKSGGQYAVRTSLNIETNAYHAKAGVLQIGDGFQDDLGYYRRTGVRKYLFDIGGRPRLPALARHGIREMHPHITWTFYTDLGGHLIAKKMHTGYTFFLNDGGFVEFSVNPNLEEITDPFAISPDIAPIPAGRYGWTEYMIYGGTDPSRPVSISGRAVAGGLWSGQQRTVNATLTVRAGYRFSLATGLSRTSADLDVPANAHFTATLVTARANYSFSTNMFLDALAQYDAADHLFNANVRFNFIHHPLSDLYLVLNEQHLSPPGLPPVAPGRSVTVKFTQMLAF